MRRTGKQCPRCEKGKTVERINKATNAKFIGCDQFPECKHSKDWDPKPRRRIAYWPTHKGMDIDECYESYSGYSGNLNGDF